MADHSSCPVNLLFLWNVDERVLSKLKGTGFDTLRGFPKDLRHNYALLNALIDKYDVATSSFNLGFEPPFTMTCTLEDILYITGLPIDGKPVTGIDPINPESVCQRYLGTSEGYGTEGRISLNWLRENFMRVDENMCEENEEFYYHIRAYVMYVIGCTIAPCSNSTVSIMFLHLLEKVDEIGTYAWGAALLANLLKAMESKKKPKPIKELTGFFHALMVFAFERMPSLLGDNVKSIDITTFPLVVGWTHKITRPMLNSLGDKLAILSKLEALTEDSVNWQPYRKMDDLPEHLRAQWVLGKSRTILICFEKAVYHRPDLCPRQFNLLDDIRQFNLVGDIVLKKRTGPKSRKGGGTDWSKKDEHVTYISEWNKRFQLLIDNDGAETGSSPPSDSAVVRASSVDNKMTGACPKRKRDLPLVEKMSPKGPRGVQTGHIIKRMDQSFQPLTMDDDKKVDSALSDSNRNKILASHHSGVVITGSVLQCLKKRKCLNSQVINLYLELLKERENRDPNKFLKCHFFSTNFYSKLVQNGYSYNKLRRWTTKKLLGYTIFDCDMIFIPINQININHWALGVINKKEEKFEYLDSIGLEDSHVTKILARYYVDEVKDHSNITIDVGSWKHEIVKDLPKQTNGHDCGVFMIKYIDFYSRNCKCNFDQGDISYFRRRTASEILKLKAM